MILEPTVPLVPQSFHEEVARRRTFAIISHPDAGKTTLTEKLLLYAGSIDQAGAVRARRSQRQVVSDWMAIEQEHKQDIKNAAGRPIPQAEDEPPAKLNDEEAVAMRRRHGIPEQ